MDLIVFWHQVYFLGEVLLEAVGVLVEPQDLLTQGVHLLDVVTGLRVLVVGDLHLLVLFEDEGHDTS